MEVFSFFFSLNYLTMIGYLLQWVWGFGSKRNRVFASVLPNGVENSSILYLNPKNENLAPNRMDGWDGGIHRVLWRNLRWCL